jgi:predicted nucleic acid-binding protein
MKLDDAFSLLNRVFLDTAPVIYYIERNPQYFPTVRLIFQQLMVGRFQAVTSPVTLAECLVKPIRDNLLQLQQDFVEVVTAGENTSFMPIDAVISRRAAELRVQYGLKLPDALQISIAITTGCDGFLTNDEQLKRVTELQVLILKELDV